METAVKAPRSSAEITSAIIAAPIIAAPSEPGSDEERERWSPIIRIAVAIVRVWIRIWRVGSIVWRRSRRFGCVGPGRGLRFIRPIVFVGLDIAERLRRPLGRDGQRRFYPEREKLFGI